MTHYRRYRLKGGCYSFPVVLAERRSRLLTVNIQRLRTAFREVEQARLYKFGAVVILPDHLSSGGTNGYRKHNPRLVELAALAEDAIGNKTLAQASNRLGER